MSTVRCAEYDSTLCRYAVPCRGGTAPIVKMAVLTTWLAKDDPIRAHGLAMQRCHGEHTQLDNCQCRALA